jgi:aspartyl-tRNA(Asn)/glutamyl-tRNA(Gln) amidotransferase subunit B
MKISEIKEFSIDEIKKDLPELPWDKRERLQTKFGMTEKEAAVFVESQNVASYFESIIEPFINDNKKIKLTVNYLLTDYLGLIKKKGFDLDTDKLGPVSSSTFSELIGLIANGDISSRGAKDLLNILIEDSATPSLPAGSLMDMANKNGLIQKSDIGSIEPIISEIISTNTKVVDEYKAGKTASLQFLIGQAMKATKGSANPEIIKKILIEKLG